MTLNQGLKLGDYLLDVEFRQDDWFIWYAATCPATEKPVILKIVASPFADDKFFIQRLSYIYQRLAELEHININPTSELQHDGGYWYVVQESVAGRSLEQVIAEEGAFSLQRMQFVMGQIASALDYMHHHGVTHGELSAHQVYLAADDNVTITNFGETQVQFGPHLTGYSFALTTPEILAPERVRGQIPSRAADLYSLGILCYHMLARQPPFNGSASAVLHAQAYKQPPPLHRINPGVSIPLSETIDRMLAKSVDIRYHTGAEFATAVAVTYRSKKTFRYDKLQPLQHIQRYQMIDRGFVYFCIALIFMLMVMGVSIWAGYETGLKQPVRVTSIGPLVTPTSYLTAPVAPPPTVISEAQVYLLITATPNPMAETNLGEATLAPTSNSTLPQEEVSMPHNIGFDSLSPTVTTTPMRMVELVPTSTAPPLPTATPTPPANETTFVFTNPTGYDLIIDLTGPTVLSELIVPHGQQEFELQPGTYQYIVHTTTGKELPTVVGTFELPAGESLTRDYYSQHDVIVK